MKVLTLNTWGDRGPWERRWEIIFEGIEKMKPDVVGLHASADEGVQRLGDASRPLTLRTQPIRGGQIRVDRAGAECRDADALRLEIEGCTAERILELEEEAAEKTQRLFERLCRMT